MTTAMHPPITSEFVTTDPEVAAAAARAAYIDLRLRISGSTDNFHWGHRRRALGPIHFDSHVTTLRTHYLTDPLCSLQLLRLTGGRMEARTGSTSSMAGPGDVMLMNPERDNDLRYDAIRCDLVGMDMSLLDQLDPEWAAGTRWEPTHPLSPHAARAWLRCVEYVSRTVLDDDGANASPLVLGAAGRLLAATALSAYRGEPAMQPHDRSDAVPNTVRQAVAFIESSPDLDIGVADIARAAQVSVRAVQLAFRRHLDTTPLAHLRRVRLGLAHADLSNAVPGDGSTVTSIAARWGYPRSSRFAADYRAAYGRHPHQTLRDG